MSMTLGEKLVGISFNPSGDEKVNRAKELCAELADLVEQEYKSSDATELKTILYNHTMGEISKLSNVCGKSFDFEVLNRSFTILVIGCTRS